MENSAVENLNIVGLVSVESKRVMRGVWRGRVGDGGDGRGEE